MVTRLPWLLPAPFIKGCCVRLAGAAALLPRLRIAQAPSRARGRVTVLGRMDEGAGEGRTMVLGTVGGTRLMDGAASPTSCPSRSTPLRCLFGIFLIYLIFFFWKSLSVPCIAVCVSQSFWSQSFSKSLKFWMTRSV